MWIIEKILNKNYNKVLKERCMRELNLEKCIIKTGQSLKIEYLDGIFFGHEQGVNIVYNDREIVIYTTKKIWFIKNINK